MRCTDSTNPTNSTSPRSDSAQATTQDMQCSALPSDNRFPSVVSNDEPRQPPGEPVVVHRDQWSTASEQHFWKGAAEGTSLGTNATVLFYTTDKVGEGPRLHVHPYDEIFIVRQGRAMFTIGNQRIAAEAGDVLMGPANVPHKFHNLGPGILETTDIHLAPEWVQSNLPDPT